MKRLLMLQNQLALVLLSWVQMELPKDIRKSLLVLMLIKVISPAPCPVITIKGKSTSNAFDMIALPLDLNKETREKVREREIIQFSRLFNSEIRAFSVSLY